MRRRVSHMKVNNSKPIRTATEIEKEICDRINEATVDSKRDRKSIADSIIKGGFVGTIRDIGAQVCYSNCIAECYSSLYRREADRPFAMVLDETVKKLHTELVNRHGDSNWGPDDLFDYAINIERDKARRIAYNFLSERLDELKRANSGL